MVLGYTRERANVVKEEGLGTRLSAFYEHQPSTKTIWSIEVYLVILAIVLNGLNNAAAVFGIKISIQ